MRRAGRRPRKIARTLTRAFVSKNRWSYLGFIGIICVLFAIPILLFPKDRPFLSGFLLGNGIWIVVFFTIVGDGSLAARTGAWAESWTSDALKRLRWKGWYHLDGIDFEFDDVDHVMVGPGGLFVIETKHLSRPDYLKFRLSDAVSQVQRSSKRVSSLLRAEQVEVSATGVVIFWGASKEDPEFSKRTGDVVVLHAGFLDDWFRSLQEKQLLSPGIVEGVREVLQRFMANRDKYEVGRRKTKQVKAKRKQVISR